jgi:UDP-glucuronate decarboxylase
MKIQLPKKALVTGGAGFLGSHLCRRLLADGYEVTAVDNLFTGSKKNIADLLGERRFSFVQHDIVLPYWGQFDEIYNLACPASPVHYQHNPVETMKTSVVGMMNMLELAMKTKAKILHASTSEVYGDPLVHPQVEKYWGNVNTIGIRSCYDEGKRCAETMAADYRREYGVDARMVRIFNTYGPNMHPQDGRVISNFIMQALNDEDITLFGDGLQTRSFQYCDDLIEAMRRYMELPRETVDSFCEKYGLGTPVINTGNPGEYTIKELAEETLRQLPKSKSKLVYRPLPSDDPKRRKPDITLAKELLDWEPKVSLSEGLAKTIEYFRSR